MWIPPRPASEHIPAGASPVRLVAYRTAGATAKRQILGHRTLTGADASRFVRLANALHRENSGPVNCAADPGFRIDVRFVEPRHQLVLTEWLACGLVLVARDGTSLPPLQSSPAFYRRSEPRFRASPSEVSTSLDDKTARR